MRNVIFYFGFILIAILIFDSCKHTPEYAAQPNPPGTDPPFDTISCDSTNVTYAGVVYPILEAYCLSCHSGALPAGGLDFEDFDDVAWVVESGQLLGSLKHKPDYSPMPQDAPKLSVCEIALIEKWINDTTFTPVGGGGIPCDPDTVYFQNDVLPLLLSSCGLADCHDEQTAQDDVILTSYYWVMQTADVVPFEPWESDLFEKITEDDPDDRMPPPPASMLSVDQIDMIYTWIAQGALNNHCEQEDCDSVNVTFSETIFPIVQNNCLGCHSGPDPNGGISLENYNAIVSAASIEPGNQGSLLGAVTWATGNTPMPENGPQISDCDITQIQKWIDDGMPDN